MHSPWFTSFGQWAGCIQKLGIHRAESLQNRYMEGFAERAQAVRLFENNVNAYQRASLQRRLAKPGRQDDLFCQLPFLLSHTSAKQNVLTFAMKQHMGLTTWNPLTSARLAPVSVEFLLCQLGPDTTAIIPWAEHPSTLCQEASITWFPAQEGNNLSFQNRHGLCTWISNLECFCQHQCVGVWSAPLIVVAPHHHGSW